MHPHLASFEDYLPLLIFFGLWWIVVKKLKSMGRQPPKPTAPPAPRTDEEFNLQEALHQVLTGQVEMPKAKDRKAQPGPLPEPAPPAGHAADLRSLEEKWEGKQISSIKPASDKERLQAAREPAPSSRPLTRPPQRASRPAFAARAVSHRALRQAVVWSEILGPPVSLRE